MSPARSLRRGYVSPCCPSDNDALGDGVRLRLAQRIGLRLSASLRHGFREIREQYREPEPQCDLQIETAFGRTAGQIADQEERGYRGADFDHEDNRILQ